MTEKHVHHHEGRGLEKTRHVLQQTSANASSSDLFLIRIGFRGLKTKFGKDFYFRTAASGLIFLLFSEQLSGQQLQLSRHQLSFSSPRGRACSLPCSLLPFEPFPFSPSAPLPSPPCSQPDEICFVHCGDGPASSSWIVRSEGSRSCSEAQNPRSSLLRSGD